MFFLCYSITGHENPQEIFPYGDPPAPHWKIRQIDPPSPLENPIPSVGGGGEYGYFLEPHNVICTYTSLFSEYSLKNNDSIAIHFIGKTPLFVFTYNSLL